MSKPSHLSLFRITCIILVAVTLAAVSHVRGSNFSLLAHAQAPTPTATPSPSLNGAFVHVIAPDPLVLREDGNPAVIEPLHIFLNYQMCSQSVYSSPLYSLRIKSDILKRLEFEGQQGF